MRPLGFGEISTGGVHETGTYSMKLAMASMVEIWSEREIQVMVLISLMLQLFLLFTGNLRRRRINGLLRFTVWLAYVGADSVAVYAIGLFSQYEGRYKLRSHSPGDTLPFLWLPFLLVHLGGQDTITAFSIEDNNLWLRHLLNLIIQVTIALYVFWKSRDIIDSHLLVIAMFIFVAGIIKYGERTWALNMGSRDSLGNTSNREEEEEQANNVGSSSNGEQGQNSANGMASYALHTVLCGKGLLAGRTLWQLGDEIISKLVRGFAKFKQRERKLKVIEMELDMMYDLLYTKAMVLHSWTSVRYVAQISMVVAFALFLATANHAHNDSVNVAITFTLFAGAIFIEACSVSMAIASPWARAHIKEGTFLCWLSRSWACSPFKAMQRRRQQAGRSMGQFNLTNSAYSSQKPMLKLVSKIIRSFGLEKHWRNIWHIEHIEDKEIVDYIEGFFDPDSFRWEHKIGPELNFLLRLPFEHALFRLHIFTDLRISSDHNGMTDQMLSGPARECEMLSNYLMYLMAVHPSMLPVSSAAQDIELVFAKWFREHCGTKTKLDILQEYARDRLSEPPIETASWEEIKEVWVRLLIYAAGKCPGELHARQLGNGGETLSFVWTLMMHHKVGAVGRELNLLTSDNYVAQVGTLVSVDQSDWVEHAGPLYAFKSTQDNITPGEDSASIGTNPSPRDTGEVEIEEADAASEKQQAG